MRQGIEPGVTAWRPAALSTTLKFPAVTAVHSIYNQKTFSHFIITSIFQVIEFDWINISVRESGSVIPDSNSYLGTRDLS